MFEFFHSLIAGPVLPASLFLAAMVAWSLLVICLGVASWGLEHAFHWDHGIHVDHGIGGIGRHPSWTESISGLGMVSLRWLNIHEMPIMIWMAVFSMAWWVISLSLWMSLDTIFLTEGGWFWSPILIARNLALALPLTKVLTQPFRGWFSSTHVTKAEIIGRECEISSSEANPSFGQVRLKTDAAPLLLNVCTDGPHLPKGSRVWITHYDAKRRVYLVSPTSTEHNL